MRTEPTISFLLRLLLNVTFTSVILLRIFMSRHAVKINLHWEALDMHIFFFRTFGLLECLANSEKDNGDAWQAKQGVILTFSVEYHLL